MEFSTCYRGYYIQMRVGRYSQFWRVRELCQPDGPSYGDFATERAAKDAIDSALARAQAPGEEGP